MLEAIKGVADTVASEVGQTNAMAGRIFESYSTYRDGVDQWTAIAERAFLNARG